MKIKKFNEADTNKIPVTQYKIYNLPNMNLNKKT
jgi:hypothetical protein